MSLFVEVVLLDVVLRKWKQEPSIPRRAYHLGPIFESHALADEPFSEQEIRRMKRRFKKLAPTRYEALFRGMVVPATKPAP